jgi:hypothetical protein
MKDIPTNGGVVIGVVTNPCRVAAARRQVESWVDGNHYGIWAS